jgi:urease accessory protein
MSADAQALLRALQHADNFFPSGGTAFSWGIEGMIADGIADLRAQLGDVLRAQVEQRWATFDRGVLACAFDAQGDLERLGAIDREVETMLLPTELREGSRRAGASLLDVHARIGTTGAAGYRAAVQSGAALGHLNVVQGCVWFGQGLTRVQAQAVSAHAFCISLLSAAIRLGATGHIQAQRALADVQQSISIVLTSAPPPLESCASFTPQLDIAAMRHETQAVRLFVN